MTQIGSESNVFYVISWVIKSHPNRDDTISGTDRIELQNMLEENQKFGCLLDIEDSNVI